MKVQLSSAIPSQHETEVLVVPVVDHGTKDKSEGRPAAGDDAVRNIAKELAVADEITGKSYETVLLHRPQGVNAKRVLFVGGGKAKNFTPYEIRRQAGAAVRFLKSKQFKREGPLEIRLKKANNKHQYADLELMVDDRNLSQKHVNLYQPVMFYTPDSPQAVEIVINEVSKDHIHGYVSAPKYRKSELAAMAAPADGAAPAQGDSAESPAPRKKLPLPQPQP